MWPIFRPSLTKTASYNRRGDAIDTLPATLAWPKSYTFWDNRTRRPRASNGAARSGSAQLGIRDVSSMAYARGFARPHDRETERGSAQRAARDVRMIGARDRASGAAREVPPETPPRPHTSPSPTENFDFDRFTLVP